MSNLICKRSIAGILVLVFLLALLPTMTISSMAEDAAASESPVLNQTIVGTVDFQSFNFLGDNESGSDGVDYHSTFYYTDDFFSPSAIHSNVSGKTENWTALTSTELSLASTSFDLTVAAYASNEKNVLTATSRSWDNTYYPGKDKNAEAMLEDCGFENFESYETYDQAPTNDSIGYVIASKTINVWDEYTKANKEFTLVAVAVRGAGYGAEWASNITIGDSSDGSLPSNGRHRGFDEAATTVCSGIRDYIDDHNITSDVKYWITGYSRAGATANLVAGYVTDGAETTYHTHQRDVYGYTWECPQGASTDEDALDYLNIHNIINAMDAVPKVSPDEFNHQRLGVDYVMPYYGNTTTAENTEYYTNMREVLQTIAVGAYNYAGEAYTEDPLIDVTDPTNYPYNRPMDIYTITATKLISDAVGGTLMDNFGTVAVSGSNNKLGTNLYIDKFVDNLIDVFLVSGAWKGNIGASNARTELQNRQTFIQDYQDDFRNVLGYLLDFSGPAFLGMVDAIVDSIGDQLGLSNALDNGGLALAFTNFYNDPTGSYSKYNILVGSWRGQPKRTVLISEAQPVVKNVMRNMTSGFTDPQGITQADFEDSMDHLVELVVNLYADELSRYNSNYFGTSLHYMWQILCTHEQEVVMSWIKSLDPNHINRGYRTLTVPKTTDVKLYEFRDQYEEYDGTLSAGGTGALVAELNNADYVKITDPRGVEVNTLDQRISVTESGDNMVIRYPSMLDIRLDITTQDEDTSFDDVSFQVADYMTNTMTTALSDGENQYDPDKSSSSNYTAITSNTSKTNASTINGYDSSYTVPLSSHDTLQIMANGSSTYDNSASGDPDVYSINKMVYVNTIVEGQFRSEDGDVETYLPYVMDQEGTVKQTSEMEEEVSYTSIHGIDADAEEETGNGDENPDAHIGNSFAVDLPTVKNNNKVAKYFITDASAANNQKLSSESEAYLPTDLVTETTDQFTYDTGTTVQSRLEAADRVYHVYYAGDFAYTVTWKDADGNVLETDENVKYNAEPEYNGETPTKDSDDEDLTWVFTGWTPELTKVTEDATYTAEFEQCGVDPATFTLVHEDGEEETITVLNAANGYNVAKNKVGENMMYGGLFTDSDYKNPTSTPGTELIPENGQTYYLREVSMTYLHARNVYLTKNGSVIGTYGVAVTDCNNYKEAGFLYNGERIPSLEEDGVSKLYSEVTFANVNNNKPFYPKNIFSDSEEPGDDARIVVSKLDTAATGTVQAYWITADNVLVTGDAIRTLEGGYKVGTSDDEGNYAAKTNPYSDAAAYQETGIPVSTLYVDADDEEETIITDTGVKLAGYTTSLNGKIEMNFYLELSDDVAGDEDAAMQFTLPGTNHTAETVKLADARKQVRNGKTYYVFSAGVAAKDMTSDIQAQFVQSDGTKSEVWIYTIKDYCDYIRNHPDTYDAESVALVENMLNYGGYAQTFFKYNTEDLANADLDLELPEAALDASFDPVITGELEGLTYLGSSAMLTTTTGLRHYFSFDGDAEDYTFKANGETLEVQSSGENSYVLIDNISAKDLPTAITLTVTDKDGNEMTLAYSVYTNIKQVVGSENFSKASQNLMRALYGYGEAAKAYLASRR